MKALYNPTLQRATHSVISWPTRPYLCTEAIQRDLFVLGFTCVSLIRGPVLKLRVIHCSTGKVNGLGEIPDP